MFEKEAEENGFGIDCTVNSTVAWQKGATFGYNKANEWHFVKDEFPPEDVPLLCISGGKIYVAWYYNGIYHDSRCCQVKKPYAWKEIVLPELPKE